MVVNYPETILNKSQGTTSSEEYLSKLCNNTFLSFWSFPNVYRDQGKRACADGSSKGDGKELCDLFAVFDNHIFIFSDKHCEFAKEGDILVNWGRWYKKAVEKAAEQIWGAERWIFQFPKKIYLDKNCTQSFPYSIPSRDKAIVHRIIVAHGASEACKKHFGGSGSFLIMPRVIGDMHKSTQNNDCVPFTIGTIDPDKGYIHVFDDTTLEIIMRTLDTISDFTQYLTKKEELISSERLISASGDDDLLAYYLQRIDKKGEHTFYMDGMGDNTKITIMEGFWGYFVVHPSRLAQISANKISYMWDSIIEKFIHHIFNGTSYHMSHPELSSQEEIFRILARENRTRRRFLANSLKGIMDIAGENKRATRLIKPTKEGEPYYLFLILPRLKDNPDESYREFRRVILGKYLQVIKLQFNDAKDIIGFATETINSDGRSEDIVYLDGRDWSESDNKEAEVVEKELRENGLLSSRQLCRTNEKEYPNKKPEPIIIGMKGFERNSLCPCHSGKKFKKCCGAIK